MSLTILFLLYAISSVWSMPARNTNGGKCFHGGIPFKQINSTGTMSEICSRDDISMIKSIGIHSRLADSSAIETSLTFYRLYYVKNWFECNPVQDYMGTFMVLDINPQGLLVPKTYACRAMCDINIDRDIGAIQLDSAYLNHYTIEGTTIKSGWFKSRVQIMLDNTCEDVHITCGHKTLNIHACFRQHKACIRYFRGSILPEIMIESICSNAELILLLCFIAISTILAAILTRTYLVYLLIPVFYPIVKMYALLYERCIKKCKNCMLAMHPFSNCPTTCICGMVYNSTEALKVHRQCKNCVGYKTLTKTRTLCKKKLPNMFLAATITVMFFSFITPITAQCYNYSTLPQDFQLVIDKEYSCKLEQIAMSCIALLCISLLILSTMVINLYIRIRYVFCAYCGMVHEKKGLILHDNFTSHCLTCICTDKSIHRSNNNCIMPLKHKTHKYTSIVCAFLLVACAITPVFGKCLDKEEITSVEDASLCIGLYQNVTKAKTYQEYSAELSKKISSQEITILMPDRQPPFDSVISKAQTTQDLHTATLYELIASNLYPENIKKHLDPAGPNSIQWRIYLQTNSLYICNEHVTKMICRCILKQEECMTTTSDHAQEIENYYKSHKAHYRADMLVLYTAVGKAIPGLVPNLLQQILKNGNYEDSKYIFDKLLEPVKHNNQLTGIIKFLRHINEKNIISIQSNFELRSEFKLQGNAYNTKTTGDTGVKECVSPLIVACTGKRYRNLVKKYISCSQKLYVLPELPILYFDNKLCIGDRYCLLPLTPLQVNSDIQHLKCFASTPVDQSNGMNKAEATIRLEKLGECKIEDKVVNIAVSMVSKHFPYDTVRHKQSELVDDYCLSQDCTKSFYPYHPNNLKECTWSGSEHQTISQKFISHNDIESFISAIKLSLHNDLVVHNFKPLANMPHVKPSYKSISLQGTVAGGKVQDSYIVFNVPLITGLSQGYTITAPDGLPVMDAIVYIKSAKLKATYSLEYQTGPTISINTDHNEKCTGTCPTVIPKKDNWLTFSKEHTSAWGCEEWGCIAIGTGCVYGSCQDVIRPEAKVYKKINQDQPDIELCVTDPSGTLCNTIDALEPIIGEHFQVEIHTTQTNLLPDRILEKNKLIYTGQINAKGTFNPGCGSVQLFDSNTYGIGNPKFDYICHALSRKDIVVRKCYENHYYACSTLTRRTDLRFVHSKDKQQVTNENIIIGTATVKMILGDIQYKSMSPVVADLSINAVCGGCPDCFTDVICKLTTTSNTVTRCKVESNCISYTDNIQIPDGSSEINLKFRCSSTKIDIKVCNTPVSVKSEIVKDDRKLDLTSADQTSYIKEFDKKCGTWLCRAYNEGVSFILGPLWNEIGIWGKYVLIISGSLIIIVLFAKIIKPLSIYLISLLKKNEEIYRLENKIK
uniref:Envelopment polyprotein n=1 Tax=Tinaroo virus TaxID=66264 RepID=A8QPS5_9VIRU|nr:M polyprotein [Tinaroo virus]